MELKRGRKKAEGVRHMYTIAEDAHQFIMENGGGQYLTNIIRIIRLTKENRL